MMYDLKQIDVHKLAIELLSNIDCNYHVGDVVVKNTTIFHNSQSAIRIEIIDDICYESEDDCLCYKLKTLVVVDPNFKNIHVPWSSPLFPCHTYDLDHGRKLADINFVAQLLTSPNEHVRDIGRSIVDQVKEQTKRESK
jgi:hypothetical protein